MSDSVAFRAFGIPRPQGSKRGFAVGGKVRMVESGGAKHKDWRATVAHAAHDAMAGAGPMEGPLEVSLVFWLPRPKSHPKTRRTWPIARPDVDKLVRSVCDSLTHIVWKDDSQVVGLHARKRWAYVDSLDGPGVTVMVSAIKSSTNNPLEAMQ